VADFDDDAGYRAMAAQAGSLVTKFVVRQQFTDGIRACSIIDWAMDLPVAPMTSAEILEVADDQIVRGELVGPYLRELHVHCYRMLGSFQDAEDVMQEVPVRVWRHLDRFESRSSVRQWLYRIATNRCLTFQARAATASAGPGHVPPPPNAPDVEVVALQPYPDSRLGLLPNYDPQARYDLRESVDMAFLSAIQLRPARQRGA
jgi:RNA polymerase sigma-70 factor (ECF subfamily)